MKKELLEVEHERCFVDVPLLDEIFIIPTRRKHDSGYRCMEIIGTNKEGYKKKLATYSDVFDVSQIFASRHNYYHLSMDIPECGVLRFFSGNFQFKVIYYGISTFQIDLVQRGKE
jgi:hypothetical protein